MYKEGSANGSDRLRIYPKESLKNYTSIPAGPVALTGTGTGQENTRPVPSLLSMRIILNSRKVCALLYKLMSI